MKIDHKLWKVSYKKLKSSLYYDKTQSIVRDELVRFEAEKEDIDAYLDKLAEEFSDKDKRKKLFEQILSGISYYVFPKKMVSDKEDIIKNYSGKSIEIDELQYFIKMDIRGHILGVLWLILIGYRIDQEIYEHSYGNRIRKKLYNEFSEKPTYSPYLFEPYFQQYEGWRDKAMDEALSHLHFSQDVVVLTMDFKRFYYSVDITEKLMERFCEAEDMKKRDDYESLKDLNNFIYEVIVRYAQLFDEFEGRNILPIGFLPSNVLANYALRNFDKAVLNGWNPIYFGRYVDDVIIVDKIEASSDLYKKSQEETLKAEDIITFFLEKCSGWKGLNGESCDKKYALLDREPLEETCKSEDEENYRFVLNPLYNPEKGDRSKIEIKNNKVRIFYFRRGESDALITCFKETIAKNKSEFRHMPEDEAVFQKDDYSKIYNLRNEETINKFRGIKEISIDKFELSKMLGKYLRIGGLINDRKEDGFEEQMKKILNKKVLIENYHAWEKIIQISVINESWKGLSDLTGRILEAIESLTYENGKLLLNMKITMCKYFYASLSRALALVWGKRVEKVADSLYTKHISECKWLSEYDKGDLTKNREDYCRTRMIDKSMMPIFIDLLQMDEIYQADGFLNLSDFAQMMRYSKKKWDSDYIYYPYLITMYDFSMMSCVGEMKSAEHPFEKMDEIYEEQQTNYIQSNYRKENNEFAERGMIQVAEFPANHTFLVKIGHKKKEKLKLAIANVRLNHDNFKKVVIDSPNRSYQRYKLLSKMINEAIDEKADMLIMPEAYMPFEWLTTVARTCAKNNLAMVTGVEHVKLGEKVFNLTAVILPYDDIMSKSAYISFHLKTHYAPAEKQEINGYRLKEVVGTHYELYQWNDCYFPVYCCYELTSIHERAIFQSYADFLVAIEWNRDTNYYSNILESLSRDIHCYCVQVNSSDYGDSRITKPSRTEEKDIIRTKGGINSTILVDEINIEKMREFQLKEYSLQAYDKSFKPTPPGFKPEIVMKKIKGESLL